MEKELKIFDIGQLDRQQIEAIKAVAGGKATEHQQKMSFKVIMDHLSRAHDLPYSPNRPDETAFMNGRAFVGKQLLRIINVPTARLVGEPTNSEERSDGAK